MHNSLGLYIHIPYCCSKCPYCDFFSMRGTDGDYASYVNILKDKIKYWSEKTDNLVDTVYIGGGTPSVLGTDMLCEILTCISENFQVANDAEITIEVNPASGKFLDFGKLAEHGVNRVSVGMQSADEKELKLLGRIHSREDVKNTVELIKSAEIYNISLDVMMGTPEQTKESLKSTLDFCCELDITHISSYILKIEENTFYAKNYERYSFPGDDETAELYLFAAEYLDKLGYKQYEVSNFSRAGFESKHNIKYWKLNDYLGIGPSAHSCMNGKRFFYDRSVEDFEKNIIYDEGEAGSIEERIMLGLRLKEGINPNELKEAFGTLPEGFERNIEKYIKSGFMSKSGNRVFFTPQGFLVSNTIIADLI